MDWNVIGSAAANQGAPHPLTSALKILGVAAFFLGLAACFSWAAPYHVLTLIRDSDRTVEARASQWLLVLIPIGEKTLAGVTDITTKDIVHEATERLENGQRVKSRPETESYVILKSAKDSLELPVSPVSRDSAVQKVRDFLSDSQRNVSLRLVANWKFSVIFPTIISLPGWLLVLLAMWRVARWPFSGRSG